MNNIDFIEVFIWFILIFITLAIPAFGVFAIYPDEIIGWFQHKRRKKSKHARR